MELLITGGWYDGSGECWIERVAPGVRERVLTFVPPEDHRVAQKGFTGAARWGTDLLVCSFDTVWRFDRSWRCTGRLHQPDFNDLHAVALDEERGALAIANTGMDAVEIFGTDGTFRSRIGLTPAWLEAARQDGRAIGREAFPDALRAGWTSATLPGWSDVRDGYYGQAAGPFHRRKVRDYLHPNHVAFAPDGGLLVTLLASREVRDLRSLRTLAILDGHPHDGLRVGDELWVTTTDGRVWALRDGESRLVADTARTGHVGWCRGLAVGPDWFAVGISEVVSAPQYPWRPEPIDGSESRILWFSRSEGRLLGSVDLTDRTRHAKVFTLLPWSD